ncbi:unnamed protein product [Medioppia subpectinata]|uniref:Uncharacterized protein n=1 Tax=Medioppia subpectinata TaxID=1979941 RepID=A0A7R9PZE9_9ACAR|nr:unnamed protein product [Medioppia subpectinata]CAG2107014.1 unnamed protein product [Medioppia subpectinata]
MFVPIILTSRKTNSISMDPKPDMRYRSDPLGPPSSTSSPLKSMSLTTDTLSLKTTDLTANYPDNYVMVNEYQKSFGSANSGHLREFVPYPPDIISTTVERSTGTDWGYQSKTPLISNQNHQNIRFKRSGNKSKLNRMSSQESVVTNDCSQDCNGFDRQSIISLHSFCSGIESNHSNDTFQHMITTSDVSTETEVPVVVNEYTQASITDETTGPLFELRRENANMRGKADQLDHIMNDMVKERSDLQMKLHSMEKEMKLKNEKLDEMNAQRESLLSDCEELKSGINKWESIVNEFREVVDAKTLEIQGLNEDMNKLNENNKNIRINCEHLKIDLESNDNTIKQLNKKISEMNGEMNSFFQTKVNLEEEIKRKTAEMDAISVRKEWFELELNKLQIKLNETHQKLVSEQQISINARNDFERVQTLNSVLKQQLIETTHKAVKEKDQLMRHLEGINADLMLKETEKQLFSPKKEINTTLVTKTDELSTDSKQKLFESDIRIENLNKQMKQLTENNQKLVNEQELSANNLNVCKKQLSDKDCEIQTLNSYNSDLELKIRGLNIDLKRQKELNDLLRKDKKDSESQLNSLLFENKSLETATKLLKELIEKHERSLKQIQSNLIAKESKLDLLENEKSKLLNIIQTKERELIEIKQTISPDATADPELNIFELRIQKQELEKVMNTMNTELRANQIKFDEQKNHFLKENSELKTKLSEVNHRFETLQKNVIEDNSKVKTLSEKIRSLESNVKLLTKKYREMSERKKELEINLEKMSDNSANITKILVSTQTEDFEEKSDNSEVIVENERLMREMNELRDEIRSKDSLIEQNQKIILNLEHERGKLSSAGLNSTNQHISALEVMIASKTEEVIRLAEINDEKSKTLKELETKLNKRINELESDLKKERAVVKDLRHSVFNEKRENNYIKKDMNEMKKSLSEANAMADKRKQEVIDCETEMKSIKETESGLRKEIERIVNELKAIKEENQNLKSKLENTSGRSEPLLEQLKNLSLNLLEKNQEMEGMKNQYNSIKVRNETEIQSLRQQLDGYRSDQQILNNELNELRKSKFSLQSRLTELRVALKNSYDQNQKLRQQLNASQIVVTQESEKSRLTELRVALKNSYDQNQKLRQQLNASQIVVTQESTFNEELVTKLLDQSVDTTNEAKPLVNLQACVDSLKQEMELLQKQIQDNN